jgi:hypothetical protein
MFHWYKRKKKHALEWVFVLFHELFSMSEMILSLTETSFLSATGWLAAF